MEKGFFWFSAKIKKIKTRLVVIVDVMQKIIMRTRFWFSVEKEVD
jgi:hypothetical protein